MSKVPEPKDCTGKPYATTKTWCVNATVTTHEEDAYGTTWTKTCQLPTFVIEAVSEEEAAHKAAAIISGFSRDGDQCSISVVDV